MAVRELRKAGGPPGRCRPARPREAPEQPILAPYGGTRWWTFAARGPGYGIPMTVHRLPRRPVDLRRQGGAGESRTGWSTPALRCADGRVGVGRTAHPVPARPLRPALPGTSVLTTDVIAATRRRDPSSFVARGAEGDGAVLDPGSRAGRGSAGAGRPAPRGRPVRPGAGTGTVAVPVHGRPVRRGHRRRADDPAGSDPSLGPCPSASAAHAPTPAA